MVRVKQTPAETVSSRRLHADDLAQLERDIAALEAEAAEDVGNAERLLALAQRKRAVLEAHQRI